jgi:hypothetical protein
MHVSRRIADTKRRMTTLYLERKMEQSASMTSQAESLTRCLYDARCLSVILHFHPMRSGLQCRASECRHAGGEDSQLT